MSGTGQRETLSSKAFRSPRTQHLGTPSRRRGGAKASMQKPGPLSPGQTAEEPGAVLGARLHSASPVCCPVGKFRYTRISESATEVQGSWGTDRPNLKVTQGY